MNIKLEKPITFFDVETTGLSTSNDRIIEICMIKINPSGSKDKFYKLIEPEGRPISPGAQEKHGYSNDDLKGNPTFKECAKEILDFIGDSDLGGYNCIRFDIPLLVEEFLRANIIFDPRKRNIIDSYKIIIKKEPRNLEGAYERYTGEKLENAHSAEADIEATIKIFEKQIQLHELSNSITEISNETSGMANMIDFAGKLKKNDEGKIVINFGKYKDRNVAEVFRENPGYFTWIIEKTDMASETKLFFQKIKDKLSGK